MDDKVFESFINKQKDMAQVEILFYEPNKRETITGTVKDWDNAPDGKKCYGILVTTESEAIVISPTEITPQSMATVAYCIDANVNDKKFSWRLPTPAELRLIRRNRRKVDNALASVGDSVKLARYWAQDPGTGELYRVLMRDGSESKLYDDPARVRLVATYKRK